MEDLDIRDGLCSKFYFVCSKCHEGTPFRTSARSSFDKSYDINRRMSAISLEIGIGRQSLADICALLNMPPPVSESNYSSHIKKLLR